MVISEPRVKRPKAIISDQDGAKLPKVDKRGELYSKDEVDIEQ